MVSSAGRAAAAPRDWRHAVRSHLRARDREALAMVLEPGAVVIDLDEYAPIAKVTR